MNDESKERISVLSLLNRLEGQGLWLGLGFVLAILDLKLLKKEEPWLNLNEPCNSFASVFG